MLQHPVQNVLPLRASMVLVEPPVRVVLDLDLLSHDVGPVFELVDDVALELLGLRFGLTLLFLVLLFSFVANLLIYFGVQSGLTVKVGHDFVLAVVLKDELLNLLVDARDLGDVEDRGSFLFVFV